MARTARNLSKTDIYHVMLRGINRQDIFEDGKDMEKAASILFDCRDISKYRLFGYCLMTNHIHLLIQGGEQRGGESLAQTMKHIGIRYAQYFNRKYDRVGHVFQNRYKSEPVEEDAYFLSALRYIHRNPVKAGISKHPSDYKWSSYSDYLGSGGIADCELGLELLGDGYESFMEGEDDSDFIEYDRHGNRLSDHDYCSKIEKTLHVSAAHIGSLSHDARSDILRRALVIKGSSTRQLSRVTGVPVNIIWKLDKQQ